MSKKSKQPKQLELSELERFKQIFEKKNNITCIYEKSDGKYYVQRQLLLKALEIPTLLSKYFFPTTVFSDGNPTYALDDVMNFVKYSVEDVDLSSFRSSPIIAWRNAHYVIDYHQPMGWTFVYSFQVTVIVDLVKNTLDKFELRKQKHDIGISEFDMKKSYGLDFRIDYFINFGPFSIAIEVNEKNSHRKKSALSNDEKKELITNLGIMFISIHEDTWNDTKNIIIKKINDHLESILGFTYNVMKKSDAIKELENSMSESMLNSCLSNSEFPFELEECLKIFNVKKNSDKYKMVMSFFSSDTNSDVDSDSVDIESDTESEISLSDEINSVCSAESADLVDPFMLGTDFTIVDGKIYLEKFVMFQIAQMVGNKRAREFMRLVRDLLNYIEKHSKTAYHNLINKILDYDIKLQYETFALLHETNSEYEAKIQKAYAKILKEELDKLKAVC